MKCQKTGFDHCSVENDAHHSASFQVALKKKHRIFRSHRRHGFLQRPWERCQETQHRNSRQKLESDVETSTNLEFDFSCDFSSQNPGWLFNLGGYTTHLFYIWHKDIEHCPLGVFKDFCGTKVCLFKKNASQRRAVNLYIILENFLMRLSLTFIH